MKLQKQEDSDYLNGVSISKQDADYLKLKSESKFKQWLNDCKEFEDGWKLKNKGKKVPKFPPFRLSANGSIVRL